MQIQFLVRMPVMVPVMGCPPQHALLRRGHGNERHHELKHAARLERAMRKVAVIAGGYEKHAHDKQDQAGHQVIPVKGNKENQQRGDMNERKRQREK